VKEIFLLHGGARLAPALTGKLEEAELRRVRYPELHEGVEAGGRGVQGIRGKGRGWRGEATRFYPRMTLSPTLPSLFSEKRKWGGSKMVFQVLVGSSLLFNQSSIRLVFKAEVIFKGGPLTSINWRWVLCLRTSDVFACWPWSS
jgi:hypothetical protein